MALSRFVLVNDVTVNAGAFTLDATTGLRFGTGSYASGAGLWGSGGPITFRKGQAVYADSSAGSTGPQLLYQAIGAANLRAFVDGTDSFGHDFLAN